MALFGFGKKKEETESSCCGQETQNTCACGGEETQDTCACCGEESQDTCACGGECGSSDGKEARFLVLGACCQKSTDTFNNVKKAVAELGFTDEVRNTGDNMEIARYGVMQTPALVIDGRVVSYGKLLKVGEAKLLIEKAMGDALQGGGCTCCPK